MSNSIPTYDPIEDDEDVDPQHFPYGIYIRVCGIVEETGGESECLDKLETIFSHIKLKLETIVLDLDQPIPIYKCSSRYTRSCIYYSLYMISVEYELEKRADEVAQVYSGLNRHHDVSRCLTSLTMVNIIYNLVTDTFTDSQFILRDLRKMDMKERFRCMIYGPTKYPIIGLSSTDGSVDRIYYCHRSGNRYNIIANDYVHGTVKSTKVVVDPSNFLSFNINFNPILPALPSLIIVT